MGCFYDTDLVLLFGPDYETWIYDLSENTWTPKPTLIQPSPRAVTHAIAPIFNDDKIVLFVGHLIHRKGIDVLMDAWKNVRKLFLRNSWKCLKIRKAS